MSVEKLKAEIFDLIKQQDLLKVQFKKIEETKQKKLVELDKLEKENVDSGSEASSKQPER